MLVGPRVGVHSGIRSGVNPTDSAAAMPAFVDWGALAASDAAISPGVVAVTAAGDIEILFVHSSHADNTISLSAAAGFSLIGTAVSNYLTGTIVTRTSLWWRRLAGGEGAPTVADNNGRQVGRICAIRGCAASGDPWDFATATTNNAADLSLILASGETLGAKRFVMAFSSAFTGGLATVASFANAALSDVTEVLDSQHTTGGETVHLGVASGGKAAAGVIGNTTATYTTAYAVWSGFVVAFKP